MYEKIKKLCKKKGISIYSLEKELNLSTGSVCKWKKSIPRIDTLQKMSIFFDTPLDFFIGDNHKE